MMPSEPKRTVVVFWSRRGGALSPTILELAELQARRPDLNVIVNVSDRNDLAADLAKLTPHVEMFETFSSALGALTGLPRLFGRLRRLVAGWKKNNVSTVIVFLPHVWTPILGYYVRKAGMRYAMVIHDADPHLGDPTAYLNSWIHCDVKHADIVYSMSQSVAEKLAQQWRIPASRIVKLFLPRFTNPTPRPPRPHTPLRVLFLGRILAYKGLPLLIEAVEKLRADGVAVALGIAGEGDIAELRPRLATLGAEVVNTWMTNSQVNDILSRYDIVVLPYIEASQSGVVTSAFSTGLPVVVTPVGGLPEQVEDGVTGLITTAPTADAIADCLRKFSDPALYKKMVPNIDRRQQDFSVEAFAEGALAPLKD